MTVRKWWTGAELKTVRFHASEGLSIGRTAALIGRTRTELGAAASRYGIKFAGEPGAPFGNTNRLGRTKPQTREERLRKQRERTARCRARKRAGVIKPKQQLSRVTQWRRKTRNTAKWADRVPDITIQSDTADG